ncbi:hypothetical protein V6N12_058569 [Hibiscus sabdariffa]|uniref:Endonuclease/exonuclease/phosphatase domain-containing protein n=1 Tax=Hibiscus sabdariffa TaxID=183260 RepID=A0ABR2EUD3_9ROSI
MRFTVLASLNIREFSLVVPKERPMAQQSGSKDNGMKTSSSNLVVVPSNIFLRNATFTASNIKEKAKASNKFTLKATVVPSVVGQVANIVDHGTKISSRKQSTVTIVEQGDMKSALLGGKGVKPRLNNTGKILKKDTKRGKRIRKPIDIFPTTRVVFGERIQNISSQLDSIVVSDTLDSGGATSLPFRRFFNSSMREYKSIVVALFEPCVSGGIADKNITKLGFPHSFKAQNDDSWMYFTMVYASPTAARHKNLWCQLEALNPKVDSPWILEGDFNVILVTDECSGGVNLHDGGSRLVTYFISNTGQEESLSDIKLSKEGFGAWECVAELVHRHKEEFSRDALINSFLVAILCCHEL